MSLATGYLEPVMPMVSTLSPWALAFGVTGTAAGSATYEAVNRAVYVPVAVPTVCVANRMWWVNGATVSGGNNVEAGIYRDAGYKPGALLVVTGSVAQGNASEVQFADITDTTLSPGLWWLYFSCSATAATFFRVSIEANTDELLRFQQASVGPGSAPSTATPAESATGSIWVMGFSTTTIT